MTSDSPDPSSRISKKKRLAWWRRIFAWYLALRPLNKVGIWVIIASIPIGIMGAYLARPAYRAWRQGNALKIAQNCLAKNDPAGAFAAFRQAIRIDPRNPAVWQALADHLEGNPTPDALFIRRKLTQLQPKRADHHYALAELALKLGNAVEAEAALKEFPEEEKSKPRFRTLQARVFEIKGDLPAAQETFRKITVDFPDDEEARFELDRVLLIAPNVIAPNDSVQRMRALADGDGPRAVEARRILVQAAGTAGDFSLASQYATRLISAPDAAAGDWLRFLDVEFASQSFTLQQSIGKACDWGVAHPESLPPLLDYFAKRGVITPVRLYFEQKYADDTGNPAIQQARLSLAIADRDWDKAFGLIRAAQPETPADVPQKISEVYRAYREGAPDALDKWSEQIAAANGNLPRLNVLLQFSSAWDWPAAQQRTLWAMADAAPGMVAIWRTLISLVAVDNNTPELLRALGGLVTAEPTNFLAKDQWLRLQFLLSMGEKDGLAKVARENLEAAPALPDLRLTYAMLLADLNRKDEALEAIKDFPVADLKMPNRVGDLAFVYARTGKPGEARELLAKLPPSTALLDEEVALAERTNAILEGREQKPIKRDLAKSEAEARQVLEQLQREKGAKVDNDAVGTLFESLKRDASSGDSGTLEALKRDAAAGNSGTLEALQRELRSEAAATPTPHP